MKANKRGRSDLFHRSGCECIQKSLRMISDSTEDDANSFRGRADSKYAALRREIGSHFNTTSSKLIEHQVQLDGNSNVQLHSRRFLKEDLLHNSFCGESTMKIRLGLLLFCLSFSFTVLVVFTPGAKGLLNVHARIVYSFSGSNDLIDGSAGPS